MFIACSNFIFSLSGAYDPNRRYKFKNTYRANCSSICKLFEDLHSIRALCMFFSFELILLENIGKANYVFWLNWNVILFNFEREVGGDTF